MLAMSELLKGKKLEDLPADHQANLEILLERMNKVREKYGKAMTVTSGYRSMDDHLRIYKDLAKQRGQVYDESKVPKQSKHLYGQAVDISDPDGSLFQWTKDNEQFLVDVELWMEEKDDVKRVHFQILPPKSGKRWFLP